MSLILALFKGLTLEMNVFDPIIHIEFEVVDLVFYIVDLLVFFIDKPTNFFKPELYLSDLLQPLGKLLDAIDKFQRILRHL